MLMLVLSPVQNEMPREQQAREMLLWAFLRCCALPPLFFRKASVNCFHFWGQIYLGQKGYVNVPYVKSNNNQTDMKCELGYQPP